jgi:hypothetical protein
VIKPKKWAVFRADAFPDDTVEDDHDIVVFPGRNIAEALTPILAEVGCTDVGEPSHESEHGWEIRFRSGGKWFFCQVSRIEPETLLVFDKNYGSEGLFYKGPSRHALLLDMLRPVIAADRRFEGLKWYTQEELDTEDWLLEVRTPEAET